MEISQAQMTPITCTQCGATFTAPVWLVVDINERPDLLEHLLLGTLHEFLCPGCHQIATRLDAPLLLYRQEVKMPVIYSPAETATPEQSSQQRADLFMRLCKRLGEDWQSVFSQRGLVIVSHPHLRSFAESELLKMGISPSMPQEIQDDQHKATEAKDRYTSTGDAGDVDIAVAAWQRVINHPAFSRTPQDFQQAALNHFGVSLLNRYTTTHNREDLDKALDVLQDSVERTLPDSSYLADRLGSLAQGLMALYDLTGDLPTAEQVIEKAGRAVQLSAPNSEHLPVHLDLLLSAWMTYYRRTNKLEDLEQVIEAYRKAVELTPSTSPDLPLYLHTLGANLADHFERTRKPEDLNESIACYKRAIDLFSPDSPEQAISLGGLGTSLRLRYEYLGKPKDLEEALKNCKRAVELVSANSPFRASCLNELGLCLYALYMRTGKPGDLEQAISNYHLAIKALEAVSADDAPYFTNLGNALRSRYEYSGQAEDFVQAIEACMKAVDLTPVASPDHALYVSNLSICVQDSYLHTGRLEDLDEMIADLRSVIDLTLSDTLNLSKYLSNLGNLLLLRYQQTKQPSDLYLAVGAYEKAVQFSSRTSPDLPRYLSNLGNSLLTRSEQTPLFDDLNQAIDAHEKAVQYTPTDSPELPRHLNNLASALRIRYDHTQQIQDLKQAVENARSAIAHSPAHSLTRPGYLGNLADELRLLYKSRGQQEDLDEAKKAYEEACQEGKDLTPGFILTIAQAWGNWALERAAWEEAVHAYSFALQASEQLYRVQILRTSQEARLREIYGLHASAAYALARTGRLTEAVVTVEHGRARQLSDALAQDHANLEDIQRVDPEAYEQYRQAAERLHLLRQAELRSNWRQASGGGATVSNDLAPVEQISQALEDLEKALSTIKRVPGYEGFLAPATFSQIQSAVSSVPLVYIMATNVGGLALILYHDSPEAVKPLWLPDLTEQFMREQFLKMHEALSAYSHSLTGQQTQPDQNAQGRWLETLDQILQWSWQALMGLLVESLASTPRATLVPGGLLELFPLHAAWREDPNTPTKRHYAIDTITFTYIPNARAFAAVQESMSRAADTLLAVDDPLPVRNPLKTAGYEIEVACAYLPDHQLLRHEQATLKDLRDALPTYAVLHFNGHGYANLVEPLESGLVMAYEQMLTLRDLLSIHLTATRLVLLSACETAVAGVKVPDEVISLPIGLLQAGVTGVIASLWKVEASSTMMLMFRFYELWRKENMAPPDALRQAQLWLRDTSTDQKLHYFESFQSNDPPVELPADLAWQLYQGVVFSPAINASAINLAFPFYWAAFGYTGV